MYFFIISFIYENTLAYFSEQNPCLLLSFSFLILQQGHQAHECRSKTIGTQRFEGYYYNFQKYGHKAYECRSKTKWTPNKQTKVQQNGKSFDWDYNTRYNFHCCQEYGHVPNSCIRINFRSNYNRWLSETTCFSCLKTGHVSKNCPTRSPAPSNETRKAQ